MPTYQQRLTEQRLREEIVRIGQLLWQKNYLAAGDGNISARLGSDHLLATPTGLSKGFLKPEQLLVTDMQGVKVRTFAPEASDLEPSSELKMHLEVYRQRPDVMAVVHAHPPIAIALSIAGIPVAPCLFPEVMLTLGYIPVAPYATPGTWEVPEAVRELVRTHDAIILERHGSLTTGHDLFDAYLKQERIEHAAEITYHLKMLGSQGAMPAPDAEKIIELARQKGCLPEALIEETCAKCGLCKVAD
jgi:L-fuculose-phosphate aldolase